jgi:hypothetical protein
LDPSQRKVARVSLVKTFNMQKKQMADFLLPLCPFISIDGMAEGTELPQALRRVDLVLRMGRDQRVMGMPDLLLSDVGWSATIVVNNLRHKVFVPWEACKRMWVGQPFSGPMVVWPEYAQNTVPEQKTDAKPIEGTPTKPGRPSLKVVR